VKAFLTRAGEGRIPIQLNRPIRIQERLPGADRIDLFHNQIIIGSVPIAGPVSAVGKRPGGGSRVRAEQVPGPPVRTGDDS
jgi:hypothetical protein